MFLPYFFHNFFNIYLCQVTHSYLNYAKYSSFLRASSNSSQLLQINEQPIKIAKIASGNKTNVCVYFYHCLCIKCNIRPHVCISSSLFAHMSNIECVVIQKYRFMVSYILTLIRFFIYYIRKKVLFICLFRTSSVNILN